MLKTRIRPVSRAQAKPRRDTPRRQNQAMKTRITSAANEMKVHDRTWLAVGERTQLCEKLCRETGTTPGYARYLSQRSADMVLSAHGDLFPFPLPKHMAVARQEVVELKSRPGSAALKNKIENLSRWFEGYRPSGVLETAGLLYLQGFLEISKATHHGNQSTWFGSPSKRVEFWKTAQQRFHGGRAAIAQAPDGMPRSERAILTRLDLALTVNWIGCVGAQVEEGAPRGEVERFLEAENAVGIYRAFVKENSYLWQAAWNGLHIASMLRRTDEDLKFFYDAVVQNDPGFQSFNYDPGEVGSINDEPELAHFRARFGHLHIPLSDEDDH